MASGHVWLVAFPIPMDVVVDSFNLPTKNLSNLGHLPKPNQPPKADSNQNWLTDWFMWNGFSVPTKDKSNPQGLDIFSFANIFSKKKTTTLGFEETSVKIAEEPPPHSNGP